VRDQLDDTWNRVRAELRRSVPDTTFGIWLEPLELAAADGAHLFVRAPDHIRSWVREHYTPQIRDAAGRALGGRATLEIVDGSWTRAPEASGSVGPPHEPPALNAKYTFEQFVFGEGTRLAHCAALAVAEQPGQAYNPLFIHGRPGLGKTHLLHAIGHYVERFGSGLRVRYSTGEEFTTEFVKAARRGDTGDFKDRFRGVDVLLLDDVQYLVDKTATEEEFFHTLNALRDSGRQLVLTCDRSPAELSGLQERLAERFTCGLVVAVEPPALGVRRAILEKRMRVDGIEEDRGLVEAIATRVTTSVRALEAALINVVAYASIRRLPPDPEIAEQFLERIAPARSERRCSLAQIMEATASHFALPADALLERDRRPVVARARKVAMYLARRLTDASLPEVGRAFGGRDHSTVLSAVRSVEAALATDQELARLVDSLHEKLGAGR
jgi:chromosomal replication initiator protein